MTLPLPLAGINDGTLRFVLERIAAQFPIRGENFGLDYGKYCHTPLLTAPASVTATANRIYFTFLPVPTQQTFTGLRYVVGATSNGNVRSGLYNSSGVLVASRGSDLAQGTAAFPQDVAFDSAYVAAPGYYFAAMQFSSGTGTFQGALGPASGNTTPGGMGLTTPITPPTAAATAVSMTSY